MEKFISLIALLLIPQVVDANARQQIPPRAQNVSLAPSVSRWPEGLHLAVDYYPSQWPEGVWESDMAAMRDANISYVRINEFDWSVLEPIEGQYNFTLLDKTLELFAKYDLKAIVGTPTASPTNWITQKYEVNHVDVTNTTLQFGSRRHYSFSSFDYRVLSQKITQELAQRYGNNPVVVAWQLDNEFGCHDTVKSYDPSAIIRFRTWLEAKYGTIESMNNLQGRVFWSAQYESFEAVQPPFLEIYTTNELHTLDWYSFSSDMVIDFAKEQATILRQFAPDQAITTNFMAFFSDFDHFKFAREVGIDLATWDAYALAAPAAFPWLTDQELADTLRTGLPDANAFNHALYRGVAGAAYNATSGPFGVMEMQPGVLNWNNYRVSPWQGMIQLWTLETFASSGDTVNYFRWRQVPFAQEQTLSGLHLSDFTPDEGFTEEQIIAKELLPILTEAVSGEEGQADVAFVFDYTSVWVWAIEPYSGSWNVKSATYTSVAVNYYDLVYLFFSALRRLGLSVDIISTDQSLAGYKMVVVPSLPIIPDAFNAALKAYSGPVIFGPHTGSKDANFANAAGLNPSAGALRDRLPMRVTRVETPPSYAGSGVVYQGTNYTIWGREEWIVCERGNETSGATISYTSLHRPGSPAACEKNNAHYLAFRPPVELLVAYLGDVAAAANITDVTGKLANKSNELGTALRLLRRGNLLWAFNYGTTPIASPVIAGGQLIIGTEGQIPAAGILVWKME